MNTKHSSKSKNSSKSKSHKGGFISKHTKKSHKNTASGKMAWCMQCKRKVEMIEPKEVLMKMKSGKTRKRLAATDAMGHKVSLIIAS